MPEAIPPSPYPVLGMYGGGPPPRKTLDGPYVASRPAYMMFAEAAAGRSIAQQIEDDMRSQAKIEGRRDPLTVHPENDRYWFHDGVKELLPEWANANDPPRPMPAPAIVPGGTVLPAPAVPVAPTAPRATAPIDPRLIAAPASESGPGASASVSSADGARTVRVAAKTSTKAKPSSVAQRLARLNYVGDAHLPRRADGGSTRKSNRGSL